MKNKNTKEFKYSKKNNKESKMFDNVADFLCHKNKKNKMSIFFIIFALMIFLNIKTVNAEGNLNDHIISLYNNGDSTLAYDGTTDNNLRYIGRNPNNYVWFNNELWRIIGVFNNINSGNDKIERRIKLIRDETLGTYSYDSSNNEINLGQGINEWSQSDLMNELNGDYLNASLHENTYWFNGVNNRKNAVFEFKKVLSFEAQDFIDEALWYTGSIAGEEQSWTVPNMYLYERSNNIPNIDFEDGIERKTEWIGKVAIMYPSDFGFATSGGNNINRETCINMTMIDWENTDCSNNNWLNSAHYKQTMMPNYQLKSSIVTITSTGKILLRNTYNAPYDNLPVVFLKSDINFYFGDGTRDNPYKLGTAIYYLDNNKVDNKPNGNNIMYDNYNSTEKMKKYILLKVINGDGQKFEEGKNTALKFVSNGYYNLFTGIKIDGKLIDKSKYIVEEGSTIITLKPEFIKTLDSGTHNLIFMYKDMLENNVVTNTATFLIEKKNNPQTGDNITYNIIFIITILISLTLTTIKLNKIDKKVDN